MNILIAIVVVAFIWCSWCLLLYSLRTKEVIIVDFDSVIADIEAIIKRSKIYLQNNSDKNVDDYIAAHISEQQPISVGIRKIWGLQQKSYKIVFITNRKESLRQETAAFLNQWGLKGELYMNDGFGKVGAVEKIWLARLYKAKGFKVIGLVDWSDDVAEVLSQIDAEFL